MDSGTLIWETQLIPAPARCQILFYLEDAIRPHAQLPVGIVLRFYARVFGRKKTLVDEVSERLQLRDILLARVSDLSKGTAKRLLLES